ncbi:MAG: zinc ribbon domain-containing protein, partial [Chloroflexota bacterium]
ATEEPETLAAEDVEVIEPTETDTGTEAETENTENEDNKLIVPSFIKANQAHDELKITVNPDFFVDRSSHLEKCPNCENVILRGNQFCGQCGRPITMEAVSKEVNEGGRNTARSSLVFATLALICNVVAGYFLFSPIIASLVTESDVQPFSPVSIFLAILLGLAPSVYLALEARRMAKTTDIYVKFRFNKAEEGRTLSQWGAQLSWISIGISGLLLLVLILRAATATT